MKNQKRKDVVRMYNPCDVCKFHNCKMCEFFKANAQIKIYRKQEKGYHKQEENMMNRIKNIQHELVQTKRFVQNLQKEFSRR